MKKKLEMMKEICSFAKENGNEERAKGKIKIVESVEDQLEAYWTKNEKTLLLHESRACSQC